MKPRYVLSLTAIVLLAAPSFAQSVSRWRGVEAVSWEFEPDETSLVRLRVSGRASPTGTALLEWEDAALAGGSTTVPLPFELPCNMYGPILHFGDRNFLFLGMDRPSGQPPMGHLVRATLDVSTASIHILEHRTLPDWLPYDVAWNPALGLLGLIDDQAVGGPMLRVGVFTGWPEDAGTPVLPLPASWIDVPEARQVPDIAHPMAELVAQSGTGLVPGFEISNGAVGGWVNPIGVLWSGSGWEVGFMRPTYPSRLGPVWWVKPGTDGGHGIQRLVAASSPADVLGFDIVDVASGQPVASGSTSAAREWVTVPPIAAVFECPGAALQVVGAAPGVRPSSVFRPYLRYGAAVDTPGLSLGETRLAPGHAVAGVQNYPVFQPLVCRSMDETPFGPPGPVVSGALWLGLRTYNAQGAPVDPLGYVDGKLVLTPVIGSIPITHTQRSRSSGLAIDVPLPESAANAVLLFQFVFVDPGDSHQVALSQIIGTTVWPAQPAGSARVGVSTPDLEAVSSFYAADPRTRRDADDRHFERMVRSALRRR